MQHGKELTGFHYAKDYVLYNTNQSVSF